MVEYLFELMIFNSDAGSKGQWKNRKESAESHCLCERCLWNDTAHWNLEIVDLQVKITIDYVFVHASIDWGLCSVFGVSHDGIGTTQLLKFLSTIIRLGTLRSRITWLLVIRVEGVEEVLVELNDLGQSFWAIRIDIGTYSYFVLTKIDWYRSIDTLRG